MGIGCCGCYMRVCVCACSCLLEGTQLPCCILPACSVLSLFHVHRHRTYSWQKTHQVGWTADNWGDDQSCSGTIDSDGVSLGGFSSILASRAPPSPPEQQTECGITCTALWGDPLESPGDAWFWCSSAGLNPSSSTRLITSQISHSEHREQARNDSDSISLFDPSVWQVAKLTKSP